jgi:hypothetical protein
MNTHSDNPYNNTNNPNGNYTLLLGSKDIDISSDERFVIWSIFPYVSTKPPLQIIYPNTYPLPQYTYLWN